MVNKNLYFYMFNKNLMDNPKHFSIFLLSSLINTHYPMQIIWGRAAGRCET